MGVVDRIRRSSTPWARRAHGDRRGSQCHPGFTRGNSRLRGGSHHKAAQAWESGAFDRPSVVGLNDLGRDGLIRPGVDTQALASLYHPPSPAVRRRLLVLSPATTRSTTCARLAPHRRWPTARRCSFWAPEEHADRLGLTPRPHPQQRNRHLRPGCSCSPPAKAWRSPSGNRSETRRHGRVRVRRGVRSAVPAFPKDLDASLDRMNPNGGTVAMGRLRRHRTILWWAAQVDETRAPRQPGTRSPVGAAGLGVR